MPLALIVIAFLLFMTGIKGNYAQVGTQFNQTFLGTNGQQGFFVWFGSILAIAIVFRIIQAPRAGELFIALLMLVYFLKNDGILANIDAAIQGSASSSSVTTPAQNSVLTTTPNSAPTSQNGAPSVGSGNTSLTYAP